MQLKVKDEKERKCRILDCQINKDFLCYRQN